MRTTDKLQGFLRVFEIPDFVKPWIDRFFEETEIDLVLRLANRPLTRKEINKAFLSRFKLDSSDTNSDLTTRAYRKGIINLRDDNRFEPADFHARFDKWAMFEGWKDIPDGIRNQLNAWEFAHYERQHADQITKLKKKGESREQSRIYPEYILLNEAEALLELAMHIYLMPCNCRSMMNNCTQSVYTCLRFENDRDVGWEISRSRARTIVNLANKKGLMQSGEVGINYDGSISGGICNCCPECCFPHILAEHRNAQNLWPLSRYVARHLKDRCVGCGRCTKRCPFQAFTSEKSRASKAQSKSIQFNENLCRGCGVCSTGCPEEAIEMTVIERKQSLINEILKKQ